MNPELAIALIVLATLLWLRHQHHLRRYPDRLTCHHCHGTATITDTDLLGRTVKGICPHCQGDPWATRRRTDR